MAGRRLAPEEREAWGRLARSVRPIAARKPMVEAETASTPASPLPVYKKVAARSPSPPPPSPVKRRPVDVLDGSWERQIKRGQLSPDIAIDLHGHNLASAHALLNRTMAGAIASGARVVLVVTGKVRQRSETAHSGRGAIRAEIGHWLETGGHASYIASVRQAHPRHGGDGALYVILRRSG